MKRLLFIIYLMFIVLNIMAYQPMLIEGHIWTITISGEDTSGKDNNLEDFVYYKTIGDSTINGEIYKKVYKSSDKINWNLEYLMMENTEEQKVWKYHNNNKNLIFDFTLNVGDRLKNSSHICNEIKYIKDQKGNILKRMDFGEFYWIEGYGYEYIILDGVSYYLSSVEDENGFIIDCSKGLEYYNPMVVDGYSWNIITSSSLMLPDTKMYSTQKQKIEGDSIIDGIVYKKLWLYSDANSDKRSLITLVREDIEEQKIFVYDKSVEVLLYDLGVEVGDTIKVLGDLSNLAYSSNSINIKENLVIIVDNIDFIEDPIYGKLKVVSYYNADPNFNEFKSIIYERYGMTTGWLYNNCMAYVGSAPQEMICAFDENDELVLKREYTITGYGEVKDCYIKEEIGTNIETAQKEENIYYNSQEKTLYFDIKNAETITIHDAMGKMIINRTITSGIKQLPLNLNSGVYIIHFSSNNQQTIHTKIMVK